MSAVSLKSRLPEYQPLQASGPPGLLPLRNDRLPDRPARPEGIAAGPAGPAHGRRPGKPAAGRKESRLRRAGAEARRWPGRYSAASLNSGCPIPAFLVVMPERLHAPGNDCLPSKTALPDDMAVSPAWPRPADCGHEREPYTQACMRHRAAIYQRSLGEFL